MSLASFGLMGFQYYWIRNAIRINRERFDQNVLQALSTTVSMLEKGETSDVLLSKLIKDPILKETIFKKIDPIEFKSIPALPILDDPWWTPSSFHRFPK